MNNPRSNKGRKPIAVSRDYKPAPGACVRALVTLLESSVNKKAAEPTPEPDGCDDVRKGKDAHTAIENYTP
jgi:hypothetical protein